MAELEKELEEIEVMVKKDLKDYKLIFDVLDKM